jgi:hypothetical protein
MAVIRSNESIVPFFGERLGFIRGLDPLGLQNTSEATFTLLLPGLNNVTGRIRYYSFYCWLLDEYSKQVGSTNPLDQQKFIRKAEYIVALVSRYIEGDMNSIPGSNYATNEIRRNESGEYDLNAGTYKADGATRDTYWNYYSGAFGQYYLASLQDIGIVAARGKNANVFVRTSTVDDSVISGELLADAFDTTIPSAHKAIFYDSIKDGWITKKQLQTILPSFDLTTVPKSSDEQTLLINLLLQKDFPLRIEEEPPTFRNQTIRLLLNYIQNLNEEKRLDARDFVFHCYDSKGYLEETEHSCLLGWYYYQMNEFWQYANTAILNETLNYLQAQAGPNFIPLTDLVTEIVKGVINELVKTKIIKSTDSTLEELLRKIGLKSEYEYFNKIGGNDGILNVTNSLLLILSLYKSNTQHLERLKQYGTYHQIERDGESITYFLKLDSSLNKSIREYLTDFVYARIIYRHQYVAFRKIGGGSYSTQKFIIEDHRIRYIGNFDAAFTGPRVGRLISFLYDLNIISPKDQLTKEGGKVLKELAI